MSGKNVTKEAKSIKFTDEEMSEVKFIQQKFQEKLLLFGQLSLDRIQVDERIAFLKGVEDRIKAEYVTVQKLEEDFLKKVTEKYGEGGLDANTGIFTPIKPTKSV